MLKSQKKKEEEDSKKKEITLEEFLEVEVRSPFSKSSLVPHPELPANPPTPHQRHKLDHSKLTPLTPETFAQWKKTRMNKKEAEAEAVWASKSAAHAVGKNNGMSGRDLFTFNSDMMDDSDDDGEEDDWDLQLLRIRAEKEARAEEIERCVSFFGCSRRGEKEADEVRLGAGSDNLMSSLVERIWTMRSRRDALSRTVDGSLDSSRMLRRGRGRERRRACLNFCSLCSFLCS